jgi:tripartite-type tricarboxylate transporter receptor subunit TctC
LAAENRPLNVNEQGDQAMLRRNLLSLSLVGAASLWAGATAVAQDAAADYPNNTVTIIVPYAAGGNTDAFARIVGEHLDKAFGQRFLVENKPGGNANIGTGQLARAEPDGYTLGMGTVATHAINPVVFQKLPFDPDRDFAPISLIATLPNVLVVNPEIPAKTVPELIDLMKAKPDTLTFASSGVGSSPHVAGELFMARTGTVMTHVPYKGSGQSIMDVVAGHVDMVFDNIPTAAQQAKAGTVRALAVTSLQRAPLLPDVPAMAEFLPGFEATSWHGLFAPAGTPPEIIQKVSQEVQRIMQLPEVQERLRAMGAVPVGSTPEAFQEHIKAERQKWADVVKTANISIQ